MPQVTRVKKVDPMQKAIPKNPKYADVLATVDTGASLSRHLRKINETGENFKIRPDEIFRRMKITTFVQLVIQVAETNSVNFQNDSANSGDAETSDLKVLKEADSDLKGRHTLQSVIQGIGEFDFKEDASISQDPASSDINQCSCPYLLLDVRTKDEFDLCHIIKAISYPYTMLSRCTNYEIREMLAYKNKPGHIIICYDEDESLAPRVATFLIQRGYENVFLLSGGLKVAWKFFPKGLILGNAPETLKKTTKSKSKIRNSSSTPRLSPAASVCSTARSSICGDSASSIYASSIGSRSISSTARRAIRYTFETYDGVGTRGTANGGEEFSAMDLLHLQMILNNILAADSAKSSAISGRSITGSVRSRASSTSTLRNFK